MGDPGLAVIQILRLANRTQSGGDSYDAVTRLVGCPSLVLIVADSELALPVKITIAVCMCWVRSWARAKRSDLWCRYLFAGGTHCVRASFQLLEL